MVKTLVVDDDAKFRHTLKEMLLSAFPSMQVTGAADGQEALRKIERQCPDLAFLDIGLPGENGLVLTKRIKELYPAVTIIIITNHDLLEYREAAYENGARYFFSKESTGRMEILQAVGSVFPPVTENMR
jgi:two-component system response regulator NreC